MSRSVAYVVPVKPAGQNRSGANARPYGKTLAQKTFANFLAVYGFQARQRAGWETTKARVEVEIRIFFENERPDTDSPVKAILDSLEVSRPKLCRPGAGFLANDRQVRRYIVDRENPRVEVLVSSTEPRTTPISWEEI